MKSIIILITAALFTHAVPAIAQVSNGMVSRYSFSNTTNDDMGINNLIPNSTPVFGQDRFGNANMSYICNGTSDFLKTNTKFFDPSKPYTIGIWFRTDDSIRTQQTLMNTDPHRHMCVGYNYYNNNTFDVGLGDGIDWTICKTYLELDTLNAAGVAVTKWNHFTITYDGTEWKYFIDGQYTKTCNGGTPTPDSTDMFFGAIAYTWQLFQGQLDDISIYDRALTVTEVDSVYNEPNPTTTAVQDPSNSDEPLFYPNPAKNLLCFFKPQNITLSNVNAQVIYKGKFVTRLDVSALSTGVYILTITDQKENVLKVSKLIKE
ncbi:MAG TPA: LamG-like jellyroll fold domain-containing protein [Flavipsychrobacter sp.]|nr:LamG-like jellyroll fold domain-containing protein [Flavipsychrobacter sp.]